MIRRKNGPVALDRYSKGKDVSWYRNGKDVSYSLHAIQPDSDPSVTKESLSITLAITSEKCPSGIERKAVAFPIKFECDSIKVDFMSDVVSRPLEGLGEIHVYTQFAFMIGCTLVTDGRDDFQCVMFPVVNLKAGSLEIQEGSFKINRKDFNSVALAELTKYHPFEILDGLVEVRVGVGVEHGGIDFRYVLLSLGPQSGQGRSDTGSIFGRYIAGEEVPMEVRLYHADSTENVPDFTKFQSDSANVPPDHFVLDGKLMPLQNNALPLAMLGVRHFEDGINHCENRLLPVWDNGFDCDNFANTYDNFRFPASIAKRMSGVHCQLQCLKTKDGPVLVYMFAPVIKNSVGDETISGPTLVVARSTHGVAHYMNRDDIRVRIEERVLSLCKNKVLAPPRTPKPLTDNEEIRLAFGNGSQIERFSEKDLIAVQPAASRTITASEACVDPIEASSKPVSLASTWWNVNANPPRDGEVVFEMEDGKVVGTIHLYTDHPGYVTKLEIFRTMKNLVRSARVCFVSNIAKDYLREHGVYDVDPEIIKPSVIKPRYAYSGWVDARVVVIESTFKDGSLKKTAHLIIFDQRLHLNQENRSGETPDASIYHMWSDDIPFGEKGPQGPKIDLVDAVVEFNLSDRTFEVSLLGLARTELYDVGSNPTLYISSVITKINSYISCYINEEPEWFEVVRTDYGQFVEDKEFHFDWKDTKNKIDILDAQFVETSSRADGGNGAKIAIIMTEGADNARYLLGTTHDGKLTPGETFDLASLANARTVFQSAQMQMLVSMHDPPIEILFFAVRTVNPYTKAADANFAAAHVISGELVPVEILTSTYAGYFNQNLDAPLRPVTRVLDLPDIKRPLGVVEDQITFYAELEGGRKEPFFITSSKVYEMLGLPGAGKKNKRPKPANAPLCAIGAIRGNIDVAANPVPIANLWWHGTPK